MADDDEFDELFSFGNTPTAAGVGSLEHDNDINFGIDDDDVPSTLGTGTVVGVGAISSRSTPLTSTSCGMATLDDKDEDEDDDIFGTLPPPVTSSPKCTRAVVGSAAAAAASDAAAAATAAAAAAATPGRNRVRVPSQSDEDFHAHDADTREMLDFLNVGDESESVVAVVGGGGGGRGGGVGRLTVGAVGVGGGGGGGDGVGGGGGGEDILVELEAVVEEGGGADSSPSLARSRPGVALDRGGSATTTASSTKARRDAHATGHSATANSSQSSLRGRDSESTRAASGVAGAGAIVTATVTAAAAAVSPTPSSAARAARPTIVALPPAPPPPLPPMDETRVGRGRTSALLQSSSDVADDIFAATGGGGGGGSVVHVGGKTSKTEAGTRTASSPKPPLPPPPPKFDSLSEAVRSPLSTVAQLRDMCLKGGQSYDIKAEDRPYLWCKLACHGKTLDDVASGSVAHSFLEWDASFETKGGTRGNTEVGAGAEREEEEKEKSEKEENKWTDKGDQIATRVRDEANSLAAWVVRGRTDMVFSTGADEDFDSKRAEKEEEQQMARSLRSLLLFHYRSARRDGGDDGQDVHAVHETGSDDKEDEKKDGEATKVGWKVLSAQEAEAKTRSGTAEEPNVEWDPLLGPVTATLLSGGLSPAATSVVLSNLMPSSLPLMALSAEERVEATRSLHGRLYLLACYHLPLLVLHLDRYAPGWHWPKTDVSLHIDGRRGGEGPDSSVGGMDGGGGATEKSRDLLSRGTIPAAWFVSHLAGGGIGRGCGGDGDGGGGSTTTSGPAVMLEPSRLHRLWDVLLTNKDESLKFFLALAVLEKHADALIMLRGNELMDALGEAMSLKGNGGFVGEEDDDDEDSGGSGSGSGAIVVRKDDPRSDVKAWHDRARSLMESTPSSVLSDLRSAEDESVVVALRRRRLAAEEKMEARLEEEARRHREALEEERRRAACEARAALIRARLVTYYERHCPEKVGNIDKILEVYHGRMDELDRKLKGKYGEGFLPKMPAINPKLSASANKLLSTMNQGLQTKRQQIAKVGKAWRSRRKGDIHEGGFDLGNNVAVRVSAAEVLPVLCSGHGGKVAAEKDAKARMRQHPSPSCEHPLHFYLVDSRPDETAGEQGRFPTAASLSPETLMDPDRIQQQVEFFESLRGAVHIVVMGEGFSSFSRLYDHKATAKEKAFAEEDDSRTSLCALFFVKKGFPFVSILDGGFAAAHAWLAREGPERGLKMSSVLVDYEKESSLFAQLEEAYSEQQELANASTKEKTTRALQKLMDRSMAGLTVTESRIETLYAELASIEGREKVKQSVSKLFERDEFGAGDGTGGTSIVPDVNMSQKAAELRDKFSNLRDRMASTAAATMSSVEPFSVSAGIDAATVSTVPGSSSLPSSKAGNDQDGETLKDESTKAASSTGTTTASDGIKSAMARFRATFEEKKETNERSDDDEKKAEGDGIISTMARFRATIEERKDTTESSEKKGGDGEGIKNAMARFRATLDAKNDSSGRINLSGLSHAFSVKKETKSTDDDPGDGETKDTSEGDGEGSKTNDGENAASQTSIFNMAHTGRPQFGTMLKNPFAVKLGSSGDANKSTSALPTQERLSSILRHKHRHPFVRDDWENDTESTTDEIKPEFSTSGSLRPQFGGMLRKFRSKDTEEDDLLQSMKEALEGDDAGASVSISDAASAAGVRMKSALGSVSFSQKSLGVSSFTSGIGSMRKYSADAGEGRDSGLGMNAFRKKISDMAARTLQDDKDEELISFDLIDHHDGENINENETVSVPAPTSDGNDTNQPLDTLKPDNSEPSVNGGVTTHSVGDENRNEEPSS